VTAPVITRAQAGLPPRPGNVPTNITPGGDQGGVTAHYGGTAVGGFPWDHSRCASIWRAYRDYHVQHNGWIDIAYTGGVCIHGYIFEGRWFGHRTAANGSNDGNQRSYAFCYMAGQGEALTDQAKAAFLDAFAMARSDGGAGPNVWPHHHWFQTECPGHDLDAWLAGGLIAPPGIRTDAPPSTVVQSSRHALNAPMACIIVTPTGRGYMQVGQDGGVFTFGDAAFHGSLPGLNVRPNQPIVGASITPSGGGYWMVGADGGIYAFGDAPFKGGMGDKHLNAPITDLASTPTGAGYWLLGEDGGIFAFGDASFLGSAA
jgi:hypothetical protein